MTEFSREQLRGCLQKIVYASKRSAERASNAVNGNRVRPYRCPHCGKWHLTKLVPSEYKDKAKQRKRIGMFKRD